MYTRSIRCARVSLSQFRIFSDLSTCNYSSIPQTNQHNSKEDLTSEAQKKTSKISTKSSDKTEQTVSGDADQISHTATAYDKDSVYPDQEIKSMKEKNNQRALKLVAPTTLSRDQPKSDSYLKC
ncbi:7858_t:CDS:2 [Gigaspora margarita]|uniref:7858_t:CDS:1 n=1 Tax=Gigaspora margarita TaxID=4874 RepID=A0ABM8W4V1_GIGMA|nr:7858_t:CDS:2 [Gigaspora margarita]